MEDMKPKRRVPRYFLLLVFILLISVLGTLVMMNWLYEALAVYESKTPNAALNLYFERVADRDFDIIRAESGFEPARYTGWGDFDADILRRFADAGAAAFSYRQVASNAPDGRQVYVIYKGEAKLGELYLYEGQGVEGGWRVATPVTYLPPYTVTAPPHVTILVNGEALDTEEAVDSREILPDFFAELPEGIAAPALLTYQIDGLLSKPSLTAVTPEDTESVIAYDDEARTMDVALLAVGALRENCAVRVEEIAKAYVRYISGADGFGTLSAYLVQGTDFYTRMRTFDHQWYGHYTFRSFKDVRVTNIVSYSDECVVGDIELIAEVSKGGAIEEIELSLAMSLVLIDGRWMLLELKVR